MRRRSHGSRSPEEWKIIGAAAGGSAIAGATSIEVEDHRSGRRWKCDRWCERRWKCERWCERRCDHQHHTILPRCQLPPRVLFDVVRQISDRSSTHLSPNEVEAAEKRQKLAASANGHDGVTSTEDIETDPIAEVFGADKKSRCRAISSTFSVKQVKVRKAAKAIANQNTNPVFAKRLDNIEGLVREVLSFITTTHQPQNPLFGCGTPRTEDASNSVHPMTPRNISPVLDSPVRPVVVGNNDGVAPGGKEYVVLLGRAREDVAKGFIASQSTCHGREVQDDEKIIWVTEVIKPESPVYDGPQNGVTYLCEIADGGYLIWGSKRIRYL